MKSLLALFIFLFSVSLKAYSQDTIHSKINFGIRYTFFYNYKVLHHIPDFSLYVGQHNIYIGAQVTNVLKSLGDPEDIYKKDAYGINFGYRYLFWGKQTKLVPFAQFNFSIYKVRYFEPQNGPPSLIEKKRVVVENTVSIGMDYTPFKHIHIHSGIGFGSFSGFFLLINSFTPSCFVGIEYRF